MTTNMNKITDQWLQLLQTLTRTFIDFILQVTGYPTLTYFENGEVKYDAGRAMKRTAEGIIEYIKK